MDKKIKQSRILCAMFLMFLFLIISLFLFSKMNNRDNKITALTDGWNVSINGKEYADINLDTFRFSPVKAGDVVILKGTLPDDSHTPQMLRIWMCHSAITVTADGKEIYNFDTSRYRMGLSVGTGYHFIHLTPDLYGKEISFVFYVNESNAFTNINIPIIGSGDAIFGSLISDTFFSLAVGLFLLIFGVCIIAIAIFIMILYPDFPQFLYIGLFTVCIGLWTFCNKGDIQLISSDYTLNMAIEYFSLFIGPIPILLFVQSIRKKELKRLSIPVVLLLTNLLLIVITVMLHLTNIMHYIVMLPVFHILDILVTIYVIISCSQQIRKGRNQEKILLTGIYIMAACVAYDIVIFNIAKYFNGMVGRKMGISALGALLFVICMMLSQGNQIFQDIYSRLEKEALMSLAYSDNLTKLSNRARFMERIDEYEQTGQVYSILSFDLNNLKLINDRLGHANGDLLLRVFAKLIHDTFSSHGTVARMGGDEFAVLINHDNESLLDKLISAYTANLKKENENGYPFEISAAWGIASNTEDGHLSFAEVFALADKRMYLTKSDMKKSHL